MLFEELIEEIRACENLTMNFERKIACGGLTDDEIDSYQRSKMKSELAKMKYQQALGR